MNRTPIIQWCRDKTYGYGHIETSAKDGDVIQAATHSIVSYKKNKMISYKMNNFLV